MILEKLEGFILKRTEDDLPHDQKQTRILMTVNNLGELIKDIIKADTGVDVGNRMEIYSDGENYGIAIDLEDAYFDNAEFKKLQPYSTQEDFVNTNVALDSLLKHANLDFNEICAYSNHEFKDFDPLTICEITMWS